MEPTNNLITTDLLMDYLGAGEDNRALVEAMRESALDRLNEATGQDWRKAEERVAKANEAIRCMVYLDYYGVRDDTKNTGYIEGHLGALLTELQLSGR